MFAGVLCARHAGGCWTRSTRSGPGNEVYRSVRRGAHWRVMQQSCQMETGHAKAAEQQKRVLIIGAGLSGLAAARTLIDQGDEPWLVTVLESGDRVGGRACSAQFGEIGTVELGATWLHGLVNNPVYELAVQAGLMPRQSKRSPAWGKRWPRSAWLMQNESTPLPEGAAGVASQASRHYAQAVERAQEQPHSGVSVGKHLESEWQEVARGLKGKRDLEVAHAAWQWRELLQRAIDGCPDVNDMSAEGLAAYQELSGPNIPIPCGSQAVAQAMSKGLDIRFGAHVQRIEWGATGVTVTCADGSVFAADAVIVSVSLGVLKTMHEQLFKPALPAAKIQAIEVMGFGIVDKIFIDFGTSTAVPTGSNMGEQPSAAHPAPSYNLLWSQMPAHKHLPASAGWLSGMYSLSFSVTEFVTGRHSSSFAAHDATSDLAVSDSVSPPPTADNTPGGPRPQQGETGRQHCAAVAWLSGQHAQDMEALTEAQVQEHIAVLLQEFPAISVPDCLKTRKPQVMRSTWGLDPAFRGSYSYVAADSSPADINVLAEPVVANAEDSAAGTRPVVLFCGEATHRSHYGTLHGAFESGVREAQRLLEALRH